MASEKRRVPRAALPPPVRLISDRCELNRQIKADNTLLRELKGTVKKLMLAITNTILAIAKAMEKLRGNMIVFRYQLRHISAGKHRLNEYLEAARPELARYAGIVAQIRCKTKERKSLLAEKKETPFYLISKQRELFCRIAVLTEELKTEKELLLHTLDCADNAGISVVKKDISTVESELKKLAAGMDAAELMEVRLALRPDCERFAVSRVLDVYGEKYDLLRMYNSKRDIANLLYEEAEERSVREMVRQKPRPQQTQPHRKPKHRELER